jgi:pyruvate/2-oxoglutarate/acetoin dehydrogenase E1 component
MSVPVRSLQPKQSTTISSPEFVYSEQTCAEAIRDGLHACLERDPRVLIIGEGVPDPQAIFGTTAGLKETFGPQRVQDMPLSENSLTGICIGAALTGMRPVMTHQRIDFALLAMDQIINNAAKWHYMFDGRNSVPLVIRMIVGRGWGQGPQHAQSLQALFAHIPGLKVAMPALPDDAKGMLCAAIQDNNPVIFIEHRWIHYIKGKVPRGFYQRPLQGAQIRRKGKHVTVAAFSYMVIEAIHAAQILSELDVELEVIDMRSVSPLDSETVANSVAETGRLIVADTGHKSFGVAGELITSVIEQGLDKLRCTPVRITLPDIPNPTSHIWSDVYYPDAYTIAQSALSMCGIEIDHAKNSVLALLKRQGPTDIPNPQYTGPF